MTGKTSKKVENQSRKTTPLDVSNFLESTGFILEMQVSELLKRKGYFVRVNDYFLDYDENKKREVDIIASKIINDIEIIFIIECKQILCVDWVFVCSDKQPRRYYNFVKYLPHTLLEKTIRETEVFSNLRPLDHSIALAQNAVMRHVNGKKHESPEIRECLAKLPKAVVDLMSKRNTVKDRRMIFFPVVVFSSQLFTAEYKDKLKVKAADSVQYASDLYSDPYTYHPPIPNDFMFTAITSDPYNADDKIKNSPVASLCNDVGQNYLVEFVTKDKINPFLKDVENRVSSIDLKLWPIVSEVKNVSSAT